MSETESVECYRESSSTEKASTENRRATRNPVPRIAEQRGIPYRESPSNEKSRTENRRATRTPGLREIERKQNRFKSYLALIPC
ncbi:unnamed protein product [Cochlearia groenlandica]